ncbi:MAG TPA: class I SAM-dependent methyltransferase [Bacteroidetes bacterium]|nr:class I SAM-dependent methyltransferase [Bacteroidota bacterium]
MKRAIKNRLKSLSRQLFEGGQRLGINILPHHFYSQTPDIAALKKDTYWKAASSMYGIQGTEIEGQVAFAQSCFTPELTAALSHLDVHKTAIVENGEDGGYGPIEADFLYCFVSKQRPKKIVQVGCGVSTSIVLRAAKDAGYRPEVVCVEPFPMPFLEKMNAEGRIRLVKEKAQKVDLETLTDLGENDLFFVDSTHTVKPGSEVNRIILEVLPRLKKGVFVHFHDIYFPFDYKRDLLEGDLFFWAESTLLHAFLVGNNRYTIRAALSMIHYGEPGALKKLIPHYEPENNDQGLQAGRGKHFPSAIYLQTVN